MEDTQQKSTKKTKIFRKLRLPKDFPENFTQKDILSSLPKEVFAQSSGNAYGRLLLTLSCLFFNLFLLARAPWFVWPFAWVFSSASLAGLFMVVHDCEQRVFAESPLVNDFVGTLLLLPLGYSFQAWKTRHQINVSARNSNVIAKALFNLAHGPTFWFTNLGFWAQHFSVLRNPENRLNIKINNYLVAIICLFLLPTIYSYGGFLGVIKLYVVPWLGLHVILSVTTLLPFVLVDKPAASRVHLVYPEWLEYLTNDINFMLPLSVCPSIPHYRLRSAYSALKQQWGEYFLEIKVDTDLITQLMAHPIISEDYFPLTHPHLFKQLETVDHAKEIAPSRQGLYEWFGTTMETIKALNPLHFYGIVITHLLALYGLLYITPTLYTKIFGFFYFEMIQFSMTAGYHRLFSHKAYRARTPTKFLFLIFGAAALQRSVLWWVREHRAHHKYPDSDKDPYNAKQGFWYSHFGWLFFKSEPAASSRLPIPMDDLTQDPLVVWQYNYYVPISVFMGFIIPVLTCCLWGDFWGGFFYAGALRLTVVLEVTFFVNSIAHYWGETPFSDEHTPRDNMIVAILTCGEGYHNFHHAFPFDYRNAIKFYQFDSAKWVIAGLSFIGQAYDLKRAPEQLIRMSKFQMAQKELKKLDNKFDWGTPSQNLPIISRAHFDSLGAEGYKLIIIKGVIHDVSDFLLEHPGGTKILEPFLGKDATYAFAGGVYKHSNAARNTLHLHRIGICSEEDYWST